MPIDSPPQPPGVVERQGERSGGPIVDMRDAFERKTPQTAEDEERTRALSEQFFGTSLAVVASGHE